MSLREELAAVAEAAAAYAEPGERLVAVLAAEPTGGVRTYVCAFEGGAAGARTWLALDGRGGVVDDRSAVREAVSLAAMCEIAEETAAGGDLEELRGRLATLRLTENPPGIEEAEEAALALERAVAPAPRLATPAYLDRLGAATRRLERALGDDGASPFALAMRQAVGPVDELATEVERGYKVDLR